MKFMLISPKNRTVYNFRGDLIQKIKNMGYEVVVIGPNKENVEKIERLGAKFIEISFNKESLSIFSNIKYCNGLKKIMKKEKPDIVLAYTIKPVIFGTIAAKIAKIENTYSLITGLGQVYSKSSNVKTKMIRTLCGIAYKIVFKYNKKVIFQNQDDMNECIERKYLKKEKAEIVDGSGVNMNRFRKEELPEENVFLMISRMIPSKGTLEYFEAAKLVKKEYPTAKFLYLGKPENKKGYIKREEIQQYISDGTVELIGETDDVPSIIKMAKFVVLPSYYREGIPRTLLEALAMGRIIITANTIGCKETVKEGVTGIFSDIKDSKDLANKMIFMIRQPKEKIEKMSKQANKYCQERFDVKIINDKMLNIMRIKE